MTTRGLSGGSWEVQGVEKLQLFGGCGGKALDGAIADLGLVPLDAREQVERGAGAGAVTLGLQPHAHDAVEDQRQKADERVRANAVGQPVVDWRDLDVGFEDAEAALDISEVFVARDGVGMSITPLAMNRPTMNSSESPGRKNPMSSPHSAKMMPRAIQKAAVPNLSRFCGSSQSGPRALAIIGTADATDRLRLT